MVGRRNECFVYKDVFSVTVTTTSFEENRKRTHGISVEVNTCHGQAGICQLNVRSREECLGQSWWICTCRARELHRARSRLHRCKRASKQLQFRILQPNTRWFEESSSLSRWGRKGHGKLLTRSTQCTPFCISQVSMPLKYQIRQDVLNVFDMLVKFAEIPPNVDDILPE